MLIVVLMLIPTTMQYFDDIRAHTNPHQYWSAIYPSFDEEVVARLCYGDS